ncbi:MAG: esterase family protein [Gemmatimonadetes bacterium]|nr:esterase family protein [Gemmatimonadota bacterium]
MGRIASTAPGAHFARARAAGAALSLAVAIAAAASPAHAQQPDAIPRGAVTEHVIHDATFGKARKVWVYTPPGYDAKRATAYPLVIAFDGETYRDTMPLPHVLDSLAALGRTPPFVAVLLDNGSGAARIAELGNVARMPVFIGSQLLPWVRRGWHVTRDPARVIATGSSAGGLAALQLALARPDLVGLVFAQSPALWRGAEGSNGAPYEYLTTRVSASPRSPLRLVIDVGEKEDRATLGGAGPNFRDAVRRFRDALVLKGYDVMYVEVPGGDHAERFWRDRLSAGIVALSARWSR